MATKKQVRARVAAQAAERNKTIRQMGLEAQMRDRIRREKKQAHKEAALNAPPQPPLSCLDPTPTEEI